MLILVSLITVSLSGLVSLWRQLQMLQQNSYFPSRYYGWLKTSHTVELAIEAILFCAFSSLTVAGKGLLTLFLAVSVLAVRIALSVTQHKKSIKKLVLTARIKRLYLAAILCLTAFLLLFALLDGLPREIFRIILLALGTVTPILTVLIWLITKPVENAFNRWYKNDAKRILKEHKGLTVVGITGSYGKTTTKFILNRLLSEKFNTVCTPQSFNTPLGVIRTIRGDIKPQTQVFICEMGAKKTGDIKEICDIVHPDFGIITSVGDQHLDTFHSQDNVFKTKFELADEVIKNGGDVFINFESEGISSRISADDKKYRKVGFNENCDYYAENITYGRDGSRFVLVLAGERVEVTTKLLGLHSVNDIVAAAAVAHRLGVSAEDIKFAISSLKATEHRLELKSFKNGSLLIDDAYNANPVGCLGAVRVLGSFEGMRKTIITPGLIELGEKEYESNYALGLEAAKICDIIILVGKNRSKPMCDAIYTTDFDRNNLHIVSSFKEAMEIYVPLADKNSIVLIENDLPDNYLN